MCAADSLELLKLQLQENPIFDLTESAVGRTESMFADITFVMQFLVWVCQFNKVTDMKFEKIYGKKTNNLFNFKNIKHDNTIAKFDILDGKAAEMASNYKFFLVYSNN